MKKLVQNLINRNDKYFAVLPNAGYPQVVSGRMVLRIIMQVTLHRL